jgi:protocatechuate 3,4-dioxygenase beta subunit
VTVTLRYAGVDGILGTGDDVTTNTVTDVNGRYSFTNLQPGLFQVTKANPPGYMSLADADGGNPNLVTVSLAAGEIKTTRDFEIALPGRIGDRVFVDLNTNGVWDAGEGLVGVDVTVSGDIDGDGVADNVVVTTGADGLWTAEGLRITAAGVGYTVTVNTNTLPAGLTLNTADPDGGSNSTAAVTLTVVAPTRLDQDFGYRSPPVYSISGQVRDDFDGDGDLNDTDRPSGGVVVRLYSDPNGDGDPADGVLLQTTSTGTNGNYTFTALASGRYVVEETDPVYSVSTGDKDGTPLLNRIAVTIVNANSIGNDFLDAVDPSGYLYDTADGRIVPGGSVAVTGPGVVTLVQDGSSGQYIFLTDGTAGSYTIAVTPPPGYVIDPRRAPAGASFDPTGMANPTVLGAYASVSQPGYLTNPSAASNTFYYTFALASGDPVVLNNNFPLTRLDQIGDFVWEDTDGDGIQDAGETGITNVTVRLYDAASNLLATTATDASGRYAFTNRVAGTYVVRFTAPDGFTASPPGAGGDALLDSNGDAAGWSGPVVLSSGQPNLGIDAGFYIPARLYGYAYQDKDLSLTRNTGDSSASGMVVQAWLNGVQVGQANAAADGFYEFPDLRPGNYDLRFICNTNYLTAIPTNGHSGFGVPARNRAVAVGSNYAVAAYSLYSGHGVGDDPGEPVNAGFKGGGPTSSGIDLRAYQGADGIYVEFIAYDVERDGTALLSVSGADGQVIWSGSTDVLAGARYICRFVVPGLTVGGTYNFTVRDEVGKGWSAPGVTVTPFAAKMVSLSLTGVTLSFDSLPEREYEIQWVARLGDIWQEATTVVAEGDRTSVFVAYPDPKAPSGFFRVRVK